MKAFFLAGMFLLSSCGSLLGERIASVRPISYKKKYELVDKSGKFLVVRESGRGKKTGRHIIKREVYAITGANKKLVEKSVTVATPGRLRNKLPILRPNISRYLVWLDKKKYFSELKLDIPSKSFLLAMKSPEKRFSGVKKLPFPKGNGVFCFFSAVMECAGATGFIQKAFAKKTGTMNFHLIWDGHPYIQEQYSSLPEGVFSQATLIYDGKNEEGDRRFSLNVGGQSIFYFVNERGVLRKMFWVAQGLSMVAR